VIGPSNAPLGGLRIVAVEQFGAGPIGSLFLADLGADVIKVEDPAAGGDVSRYIPPGNTGTGSLFFEAFNRNKRSIALDLKNTAGRLVFERLVAGADAVFSNLRGDLPDELRITHRHLAPVNPRIVCVALTGYGRAGSDASRPGYDALIQAESGWASLTGDPDGPPTKSGLSLADYIGGLVAALGLLTGVLDARQTGRGRDLDTNLYDAALSMLSYPATWRLTAQVDTARSPLSAHPSVVPFQFFETADGYIAIACAKEKFFRALVECLDLPDLAADPRFADFTARAAHRTELLEALGATLRQQTTEAWLDTLAGVVPVAPVRTLVDSLDSGELTARGMLAEYDHPIHGQVRSVGLPYAVGGFKPSYRPGPGLDEHRQELLQELGVSANEAAALARDGAFGSVAERLPRMVG
jgi:crotonobetainyl-CoA:carnitine CoA-transferase CaiB-like acyl-CoA transferase